MKLSTGIEKIVEHLRKSSVLVTNKGGSRGSGVIIDSDGAIVTNAHVVHDLHPTVQTWDGQNFRADLKKMDKSRDLAILSIPASGLPAAVLGNSHRLRVGELVVAVGNPFGFSGATSMGIVHAVGPIRGMGLSEWVQGDLQLAPGNSGGPLANAAGQVIGLNTMVINQLAVAIPSNVVRRFADPVMLRQRLGIVARPVNMSLGEQHFTGFVILEITSESPAEAAALLPGDVLIGTDHSLFHSTENFYEVVEGKSERAVRLKFLRGGRKAIRMTTALLGSLQNKVA